MENDSNRFIRYLSAKQSVDDRALNRHVWQVLAQGVDQRLAGGGPLSVLEIGAGIGTMVERALAWGLFAGQQAGVSYTAIDASAANITAAQARLAARPSWQQLRLEAADVFEFAVRGDQQQRYDLLIAHAFLDLVDIPRALPMLTALLRPGGLAYCTINFDGATILQPEVERSLDDHIEALYHRTMDTRITDGLPSGDSRTGRHLFAHLTAAGLHILAAGSSDWVVHSINGRYPGDERYFLDFIVDTMAGALAGHAELDEGQFQAWVAARRAQIERGELVYIAHQLDFVCRV